MIAAITLNTSIDRRYELPEAKPGTANRIISCSTTAGGKGLNVARILHRLGESVVAGGLIGGDHGQYVLHELQREGITAQFTQISGESRCCINIIESVTGTQTEFLEPGPTVTPEEFDAFLEDFDAICRKCQFVTISGSLPKGLPSDTYARLVSYAKSRGTSVLLDASGEALLHGVHSKPFFIKPNQNEFPTIGRSLQQLHSDGIIWAVESLGADGAIICCEEGIFKARPPQLTVANTVGCGDAMTAAFACAARRKMKGPDALKYAIAVSAASALSAGTGDVNIEDVNRLLPLIELTQCF